MAQYRSRVAKSGLPTHIAEYPFFLRLYFNPVFTFLIFALFFQYVPALGESVVGIVVDKVGENFRVNIGSSSAATLPGLAFEGATKRNRPSLASGAVVYARLTVANKDMDPELSCVAASGKAEGFGELEQGFIVHVGLAHARRLRARDCAVLAALGRHVAFEITVGTNGMVWIKTGAPIHTILVANAVESSEQMSDDQSVRMVRELLSRV